MGYISATNINMNT